MNIEGRTEMFKGVFMKLSCMICEVKLFFCILIIFRGNDIHVSCTVGFIVGKDAVSC